MGQLTSNTWTNKTPKPPLLKDILLCQWWRMQRYHPHLRVGKHLSEPGSPQSPSPSLFLPFYSIVPSSSVRRAESCPPDGTYLLHFLHLHLSLSSPHGTHGRQQELTLGRLPPVRVLCRPPSMLPVGPPRKQPSSGTMEISSVIHCFPPKMHPSSSSGILPLVLSLMAPSRLWNHRLTAE